MRSNLKNIIQHEELEVILESYHMHIDSALEEGRAEVDVLKELGDPKEIAMEVRAQYMVNQEIEEPKMENIVKLLFVFDSLELFNLIIMLVPFLLLVGFVVLLYGLLATFIASPIIFFLLDGIPNVIAEWLNILTGFVLCVIGLLQFKRVVQFTKWLYILVLKYIRYNTHLLKRRV
ncbi:DUF1700 domain-containing protein [Halalkalibacter sp. AB-rgal2]|uniref:DUF1700 domain-containing protein n=1 Tax=Halalkalibacter sp. AB-rgal2 TaxID=3242695 RepID=UPI00359E3432